MTFDQVKDHYKEIYGEDQIIFYRDGNNRYVAYSRMENKGHVFCSTRLKNLCRQIDTFIERQPAKIPNYQELLSMPRPSFQ